jgi:hypothetical protein
MREHDAPLQVAVGPPRDSLRETLKACMSRGGGVPPPLHRQPRRGSIAAHQENQVPCPGAWRVRPNTSLKLTRYGKLCKPGL